MACVSYKEYGSALSFDSELIRQILLRANVFFANVTNTKQNSERSLSINELSVKDELDLSNNINNVYYFFKDKATNSTRFVLSAIAHYSTNNHSFVLI